MNDLLIVGYLALCGVLVVVFIGGNIYLEHKFNQWKNHR